MVRQKDNRAAYPVTTDNHYIVTLERLQNNYYGNPRFEAAIINLDHAAGGYVGAHVYRFTGHYMDEYKEARWIVDYHEHKAQKMRG
jgi:hypothetical protein